MGNKKRNSVNYRRRGERLVRLAYELEAMAADAGGDRMDSVAGALRAAMKNVRAAGDAYLDADRQRAAGA